MPASTVVHDYHLTMFPHKLFLLERNRWKMLLADLRGRTRLAISPLLVLSELMMWGYCLLRGPKFLRAKAQTYGWVRANRAQIHLDPLDQFLTLGRERGPSQRDRIGP